MISEICVFIFLFQTTFSIDLIINLRNGRIRGRIVTTPLKNTTFYAFQDIPFAEPPIGTLRFMPPVPLQRKWNDILNCTENKRICYQQTLNSTYETEDCLYLNVYTPNFVDQDKLLPVFFYIYGGGFNHGNATFDYLGPHIFMENEVIVVTANYRVGPFGFLSTGDSVLSGNAGLKDQNLALQWVQQNIHLFNGDCKKVTIGGQSSGSASVSYHILSKKSKGLFRGAIEMSGTSLSTRYLQPNPRPFAYKLAKMIDSDFNTSNTSEELLKLLQNVSAEEIDAVSYIFYKQNVGYDFFSPYDFIPVLEANSSSDAFITDFLYETYKSGDFNQVPLITGMCSEDGLYAIANLYNETINNFRKYDTGASTIVPNDFQIKNVAKKQMVGEKIKMIYDSVSFEENIGVGVRFLSDVTYGKPLIKTAQLHARFTKVFLYQFSYSGPLGQNNVQYTDAGRVMHAEDLHYLWVNRNLYENLTSFPKEDVQTFQRYVRLFSNFVKTLNPTPTNDSSLLENIVWPSLEKRSSETVYLNINDTLQLQEGFREPAILKWILLYEDYAKKPFNTF